MNKNEFNDLISLVDFEVESYRRALLKRLTDTKIKKVTPEEVSEAVEGARTEMCETLHEYRDRKFANKKDI